MKRILKISSLLFAVIILFSSCSGKKDVALEIGKGQVGSDIYAYFIDYVIINENKDKKMTEDQIKKRANELCVEYAKVNTKFSDLKLSLSAGTKAQIAKRVTSRWDFFDDYYSSIGVTKQTLTKIEENASFREMILLSIYDANGSNPVNEDTIKAYFKDNYIFFKSINGYLTKTNKDGKEVAMNANEIAAMKDNFNSLASQITADNTIDNVNLVYAQSIGQSADDQMPVSVINKSSCAYPKGFFEQAIAIPAGQVQVLTFDDYIFLVQRIDNFDEEQNFYPNYRTTCLKAIVKDDFSKTIEKWYKDSKIKQKDNVQNKCYKQIMDVRGEK